MLSNGVPMLRAALPHGPLQCAFPIAKSVTSGCGRRHLQIVTAWPSRSRPAPGGHGAWNAARHACFPGIANALSRQIDAERLALADVDADLWQVLDYCEDEELEAVQGILFGPSPFSPVVKNLVVDSEPPTVSVRGRAIVMRRIESRFRFLAANSVATLQGYRPTYREALVHMRHRLNVGCPNDLGTPDLEGEIFLHLLQNYAEFVEGAREGEDPQAAAAVVSGDGMGSIRPAGRRGNRWLERLAAPLKFGQKEVTSLLTKFGGVVTFTAMRTALLQEIGAQVLAKRLNYQAALKLLYQEGLSNWRKRAAAEAAQRGLTSTAMQYSAVRCALSMLGPVMWTWLCVDLAMKSVGTDYSRIVKTVFTLAQVRLLRTYGFSSPATSMTGLSSDPA